MEVYLLSTLLLLFLVCAVLIAQIFRIERRVRQELFRLREQSFKSVQNPHFLTNGLTAIRDSYHTHGADTGDQYVALFARFMRQTLNLCRREFITIQEEMDFLNEYLRLHELRVPDLEWEISLEVLQPEELIPPMLIQPLLENTLKHARPLGPLKITISLTKKREQLILRVLDNGLQSSSPKEIIPHSSGQQGTQLIRQRLLAYQELTDQPITFFCQHTSAGHQATISFPLSLTLNSPSYDYAN